MHTYECIPDQTQTFTAPRIELEKGKDKVLFISTLLKSTTWPIPELHYLSFPLSKF